VPILQDEDAVAAFKAPVSSCDMCGHKLRSACVREVRVEMTISEEGGGGLAPDIVLVEQDTGKSMLFCSPTCARTAARIVAGEVQNPTQAEDGSYTFPGHLPFRGKIEKWDIHFTRIGPASWDEGQNSRGGI